MQFGTGDTLNIVHSNLDEYDLNSAVGQAPLPATLKLGFSAVTGFFTNSHEIRNLTVTVINEAPVAANDTESVDEDNLLTVTTPGVLANDTDSDSDPLTAILVSDVSDGTLALNSDGSFSYTPDAHFNGTDAFTYKANDGTADSNIATVTITVNSQNDAPVANDDSATVAEGGTVTTLVGGATSVLAMTPTWTSLTIP